MKRGFTLIELVVTIAVSGIFFTLAMHLYTQAVKGQLAFTKKDASYMQRTVDIALTKKMLQEHPGKCIDGKYALDSDTAPHHPHSELEMQGTEKRENRGIWESGNMGCGTIKWVINEPVRICYLIKSRHSPNNFIILNQTIHLPKKTINFFSEMLERYFYFDLNIVLL